MKYVPPYGITGQPDASYINGDPSIGRQGSIPPAACFENPQREIVNLIGDSTQVPIDEDLHQLTRGIRDGKLNFCIDSGPLNNLQVTLFGPPLQAYTAGLTLRVLVAHTNTGPTRITVGTLNPTTLKRPDGTELNPNDILAGMIATCVCDGTYFQLQNVGTGETGGPPSITEIDIPYVHDTGLANHWIGLYSPPLADLREGRTVEIKIAQNVTGATDFKPNNFPTHNVVHPDGTPLNPGDALIGQVLLLVFDGVNWQVIGMCCGAATTPGTPPTPVISAGKSLRLWYRQPDQSSHLRRIPSQNGNRQVWTVSYFAKRNDFGIAGIDFGGGIAQAVEVWFSAGQAAATWGGTANASFYCGMSFLENWYNAQPSFGITFNNSESQIAAAYNINKDLKWHHIMLTADGARMSFIYDSVVLCSGPTSGNGPVNSTLWHEIGTVSDYGSPGFGYNEYYGANITIAEFYLVDGTVQTWDKFASNVGGVFVPKRFTGPWGINGSYLNFDDSSAATETTLGKDQSGNNNNWLPYNISIDDIRVDYPGKST